MKIQKCFIGMAVIAMLILGNISCSNYDKANNPEWFSINYPKGFEYTINPNSMGSTPEIDFEKKFPVKWTDKDGNSGTTMLTSIGICVYGINDSYSNVVDYYNAFSSSWKGKLIKRDNVMAIFNRTNTALAQQDISQQVFINYDVGERRTIVIWGAVFGVPQNPSKSLDTLTHYCIDMAKSAKASIDWVSDSSIPRRN